MYKFWIMTAIFTQPFTVCIYSMVWYNGELLSEFSGFFFICHQKGRKKRMKGMETSIWRSPLDLKDALHSSGTDYLKGLFHIKYPKWNGDIGVFLTSGVRSSLFTKRLLTTNLNIFWIKCKTLCFRPYSKTHNKGAKWKLNMWTCR